MYEHDNGNREVRMQDKQNGSKTKKEENIKESYTIPTIKAHENLKLITKDTFSFDYSGDVDVPLGPPSTP